AGGEALLAVLTLLLEGVERRHGREPLLTHADKSTTRPSATPSVLRQVLAVPLHPLFRAHAVELLAHRADREVLRIAAGHPDLPAQRDHRRAEHHCLGDLVLVDVVGEPLVVAVVGPQVRPTGEGGHCLGAGVRRAHACQPRRWGKIVAVTAVEPEAAASEHEHRDVSGGWLRPTVFGAMDGLVTNVSLIAGVGGGGLDRSHIILTGL